MGSDAPVRRWALIGCIGLLACACTEQQVRTPSAGQSGATERAFVAATAAAASSEPGELPSTCAGAVGKLVRTGSQPPAGEPVGLALLEEPQRRVGELRLDVPLPVVHRPSESTPICLLLIETEPGPAERRVLAHERIWSERVVAVERRPNPDYELARRELARLADQLDREDREQAQDLRRLTPTGRPLVDALGIVGGLLLGGIGSIARDQEFEDARSRLASVPRWIEETRVEPYQVTVADTELIRRATVHIALVEPSAGRFWATSLPLSRTDRLRISADLHPRDRTRLAGDGRLLTPHDLEALARTPVPVALSELLPQLPVLLETQPGRSGGAAEARLAWTTETTPKLAAAASARGPAINPPTVDWLRDGTSVNPGNRPVAPPPVPAGLSLGSPVPISPNPLHSANTARPESRALLATSDPPSLADGRSDHARREEADPAPLSQGAAFGTADNHAAAGTGSSTASAWSASRDQSAPGGPGDEAANFRRVAPPEFEAVSGDASKSPANLNAIRRAESSAKVAQTAPSPGAGPVFPAEASSALVRVTGAGGDAHGFYLARDKVVTLRRVLGGSSLVRIQTADGFATWGVLEWERPGHELVVLHVPRPGRPLPTSGPGVVAPLRVSLPDPGMPLLLEGRVVGVSLDPLAGRLVGPDELAAILTELKGR